MLALLLQGGEENKKRYINIFSKHILSTLQLLICAQMNSSEWLHLQSDITIPQVFPASTQSVEIYRYANVKNQNKRGLYQQPPTALHAFKGNLEDREDAEVSRKQPYLACSLNRHIMLLLGWRVKG